MQIHFLPQAPTPFTRIDEFPSKRETEVDVIGTTTPFPIVHAVDRCRRCRRSRRRMSFPPMPAIIATTCSDRSFATGPGYSVGHGSASYCVDKSRFSASCKRKTKFNRINLENIVRIQKVKCNRN